MQDGRQAFQEMQDVYASVAAIMGPARQHLQNAKASMRPSTQIIVFTASVVITDFKCVYFV